MIIIILLFNIFQTYELSSLLYFYVFQGVTRLLLVCGCIFNVVLASCLETWKGANMTTNEWLERARNKDASGHDEWFQCCQLIGNKQLDAITGKVIGNESFDSCPGYVCTIYLYLLIV